MKSQNVDLWTIALAGFAIDPVRLADALESKACQATEVDHDFRTRLLMRDSLNALANYWGRERVEALLNGSSAGPVLNTIWQSDLGEAGFPSLARRLMEPTTPDTVLQFLRELGASPSTPARLEIGGAIALILAGALERRTEDVDVVDDVPLQLRQQHELLDQLAGRYGLHLTCLRSHSIPDGWRERLHSLGRFGRIDVFRVDVYDVFLSKLFSARTKDRDDLRFLSPQLDKQTIEKRFGDTTRPLQGEPALAKAASDNWYVLYGEPLPA